MDVRGVEAAGPFIEMAHPTYPCLIDTEHRVAELYNMVNVPQAVWIDEHGVIVRPTEVAGTTDAFRTMMSGLTPEQIEEMASARALYQNAIRDWVAKGADSAYALSPDEVVKRSRPRDTSVAEGQAHFELGAHLWQAGDKDGAIEHWREVHRLDPDNFSYKRQAWSLASPGMGPFERFWQGPVPDHEDEWPYESDWLSEVRAKGAENYYPPSEAGA